MQIKVKIISGEGPNDSHEFSSMQELLDFAWAKVNLSQAPETSSETSTVHNSAPVPQKRGIIARILGKN